MHGSPAVRRLGLCRGLLLALGLVIAVAGFSAAFGAEPDRPSASTTNRIQTLAKMSFEEMMQQPVTTVARKQEKLSETPAAIEVITQEDIRRSGALTIPEALRWAPGLDVARIDSHRYAVSSRGFNGEFANKQLVLMDGRSIYVPSFGGVYWDQQYTLLDDIERIEVIRGPGGTLYGPNAMNGIISIITKSAKDTQGGLVSGAAGDEERWRAAARYGGQARTNLFYRVYGTGFEQDNLAGGDEGDGWRHNQGGFRLDWEAAGDNLVTFQGDYFQGDAGETVRVLTQPLPATFTPVTVNNPVQYNGGNLLGRWTHTFQNGSQSRLQLYYDHYDRSDQVWIGGAIGNTFDLDFDHHFEWGERQEIVWGVGDRVTSDHKRPTLATAFLPETRTLNLFTGFVQDEIRLVPERLSFYAGSKIEHNDFTGWEVQPSGRLVWTATQRQTVWAAVTRAIRAPTRVDNDLLLTVAPANFPVPGARIFGSSEVASEVENAYELGYRVQPVKRLAFDVAAFYNQYDRLISFRPIGIDTGVRPPLVQLLAENEFEGETYGGEIAARWEVVSWWSLRPSYTLLQVQLNAEAGSPDVAPTQQEGGSPQQQFAFRSQMDLPRHFELDLSVRYVDQLQGTDIPSYTAVDVRLGWKPIKNLEFSIVGQNLVEARHAEFRTLNAPARVPEVERSVYGKVTWWF